MMRHPALVRALMVAVLLAVPLPALADRDGHGRHAVKYYVALGTSLAVGVQPDANGDDERTDAGYADQLHRMLRARSPKLRLVKLGCPGETVTTMVTGGICTYPHGSQLEQAAHFLRAHRKSIALVTIDIGANDLERCAVGSTIDQGCVVTAFQTVGFGLPRILRTLTAAAGDDVPIVAMNYYNPFLAAWLLGPDGVELAQTSAGILALFNGVLDGLYGAFEVPVADVAAAFRSADFTPLPELGGIPVNVGVVCALTWMCAPPPRGGDIHPNAVGYGVIAAAFREALR